jgi:hypothetical protein
MAKKARAAFSGDRTDPKQNKSLAIRTVLKGMPNAKGAEVAAEVKKQFGHSVGVNQIYMTKTKLGMRKHAKAERKAGRPSPAGNLLASPAQWVEAIKLAKHLLSVTGSTETAIALLKAM